MTESTGLHDMARRIKSKPANLEWLRDTLAEKGITQRDLSKRLHSNPTSVNHKLNGRQQWTIDELSHVSAILNLSLPELMRGMGYRQPDGAGNEIVGRIAGAAQVSTITDKLGGVFRQDLSSEEKVLLVDDAGNDLLHTLHGGAVFYLPIDLGPVPETLAVIEAPGMIVPVVGTLHAREPSGFSIQPLACKLAPVEVDRVLRVYPVTRIILPSRRPVAPRK